MAKVDLSEMHERDPEDVVESSEVEKEIRSRLEEMRGRGLLALRQTLVAVGSITLAFAIIRLVDNPQDWNFDGVEPLWIAAAIFVGAFLADRGRARGR